MQRAPPHGCKNSGLWSAGRGAPGSRAGQAEQRPPRIARPDSSARPLSAMHCGALGLRRSRRAEPERRRPSGREHAAGRRRSPRNRVPERLLLCKNLEAWVCLGCALSARAVAVPTPASGSRSRSRGRPATCPARTRSLLEGRLAPGLRPPDPGGLLPCSARPLPRVSPRDAHGSKDPITSTRTAGATRFGRPRCAPRPWDRSAWDARGQRRSGEGRRPRSRLSLGVRRGGFKLRPGVAVAPVVRATADAAANGHG